MVNNPLSPELQRFMAQYIRTVEQLEILCRLAENRDKFWTETEIFVVIQSSHASVVANLCHFAEAGFFSVDPAAGYRFSPSSTEMAQMALDMVKTYRARPVAVIEALYITPPDPVRQFADAFRLRKDKK